ncbi:MAG TPA: hypothetical protein VLW75_09635 [Rhizomicrobium sp.]|nr:hypothetical protein [Rhizomicrobium sp.]
MEEIDAVTEDARFVILLYAEPLARVESAKPALERAKDFVAGLVWQSVLQIHLT